MKKLILVMTSAVLAMPAQAQLLSRESVGGAAVGGLIGGIIGHNNGRNTAEGAAIGAGAGLLLGAVANASRRERETSYHYGAYEPAPAPVYYDYSPQPNYAVSGAVLGGIAGGVIGHNHHRQTAEGIAIGAGAGLLFGTIAEQEARRRERAYYYPAAPAYVSAPVAYAAPVPQPVVAGAPQTVVAQPAPTVEEAPPKPAPLVQPYYSRSVQRPSTMDSANSLFGR